MAKKTVETGQDDLFNLSEETASWTEQKTKSEDGLYRPSLDKAKGKKEYKSIIRFLPNLRKDGTVGPSAIEKHLHYADFNNSPNNKELSGYYDCMKQFENEKCELCNMYWALNKSKNSAEQAKAKLISRSTKYYAYVLVIEDENQPDLVGKILIYPFGYKIAQKIKAQKDNTRNPCRVEDLSNGKDFNLTITEFGGFANYDSSDFDERCPITINGQKAPIDPETGKIKAAAQAKIKEFLLDRSVEIDSYLPQKWTDEQRQNVNHIINILSGNELDNMSSNNIETEISAKDLFNNASNAAQSTVLDTASFFAEEEPEMNKSKVDSFFDDDLDA